MANSQTFPSSGPGSISVGDITINLSGFTTNPGSATLNNLTLDLSAFGGGSASFNVINPGLLGVLGAPFNSGTLFINTQLASNTIGTLDLGPTGSFWQLTLSFQGLTVTPGSPAGSFTVVNQGTSSGSFTLNFTGPGPGPLPIPEPSSFALWASIAACAWVARRSSPFAPRKER